MKTKMCRKSFFFRNKSMTIFKVHRNDVKMFHVEPGAAIKVLRPWKIAVDFFYKTKNIDSF